MSYWQREFLGKFLWENSQKSTSVIKFVNTSHENKVSALSFERQAGFSSVDSGAARLRRITLSNVAVASTEKRTRFLTSD